VETTTGPLGQGFANGVGMALAERFLAERFNRPGHHIVDHFTYGIISDGDLMEGISHEAASLAGHLGLGKLIYFYDDNHISIEGDTDIAFSENRTGRFVAYGWHVQRVDDGNDLDALEQALNEARKETRKPSLIAVRTHIGYGSPNKQDTPGVHGEPLGPEEIKLTKNNLKWPREPSFLIPDEVSTHFRQAADAGRKLQESWQAAIEAYRENFKEPAAEWDRWMKDQLPNGWENNIPVFERDEKGLATRVASGTVLNALAPTIANLIGGSADLAPSTKTLLNGETDYQATNYAGRNLRFGVREHAMGGILNGMALHRGLIPYGATFLVFSDYMRPAIRLAALTKLKVIYVFTHDSVGVGEDGPTHQPIEQLASLRAMPNLTVIRPCDANETAEAWRAAISHRGGPVALALSRQNLPTLDRKSKYASAEGLHQGAYILSEAADHKPDVVLIASGSEVPIALEAAAKIQAKGPAVQVVSMPSWELFETQPAEYRHRVLPPEIKVKIAVEAGSALGWHRYVGESGHIMALDRFGASAPSKILYEKFGLTADRVVEKALEIV
jgi:transketolase